ncbi:TetR/AcrR family transcriptional regulator [Saccharothrix sp. ST-888]|uniref:TetR/AcrR family transcriptional regulator n=1 Tax=Saccharothrix sp. ST-888 TaxID=1427391 RepID=UPI0009E4A340|nr:TetR/AcrR family transcriptional regulator [Saccharothrix sp. ST-888]
MTDQERVLGRPVPSGAESGNGGLGGSGAAGTVDGVVPEQRGPGAGESYGSAAHGAHSAAYGAHSAPGGHGAYGAHGGYGASEDTTRGGGPARLRVDARRNLESVLRSAREVFGELGYDAPMEEVARRAGVGVGTVYRRFPSKEVLVQRIAAEEVAWLTEQARESLHGGADPWEALAGYLARAVGSGAGRLLPPSAFRYAEELGTAAVPHVPEQRLPEHTLPEQYFAEQRFGGSGFGTPGFAPPAGFGARDFDTRGFRAQGIGEHRVGEFGFTEPWVPEQRASEADAQPACDADPRLLLHLLAALVARARAAGELRPGVTVSDVVLVLTAAVPVHVSQGQPVRGAAAVAGPGSFAGGGGLGARDLDSRTSGELTEDSPGGRLLQILLNGLRAR